MPDLNRLAASPVAGPLMRIGTPANGTSDDDLARDGVDAATLDRLAARGFIARGDDGRWTLTSAGHIQIMHP
jgi:hypothetical protein